MHLTQQDYDAHYPPIELHLQLLETPFVVQKESKFPMRVRLTNNSRVDLKSQLPNPVHLSYHYYSEAQQVVAFDGLRTTIPTLKAGSTEEIEMQVAAPSAEGRFLFRLTLVQERVMWFDGLMNSPKVYLSKHGWRWSNKGLRTLAPCCMLA